MKKIQRERFRHTLQWGTLSALIMLFVFKAALAEGPASNSPVSKFKIATPPSDATKIKVITIHTGNMTDRMDPNYLGMQLRLTNKGYYGLEAESGQPMTIRIYMNMNEPVDEKFLKAIVEQKELQMPVHGGGSKLVQINFQFLGLDKETGTITRKEFLVRQFDTYSKKFSRNNEKWGGKNEAVYELEYPGLDKPLVSRNIPVLSSHLAQNEGFLGIETLVNDNEEYAFRIIYSRDALDDNKIWEVLTKEKWTSVSAEGEIIQIDPKISFSKRGATISKQLVK